MLSIAEEPRAVFAIGLVDARARARAVIHCEPVAESSGESTDEGPGTGGILERESPVATSADNGDRRATPEPGLQEGLYRCEIDEGGEEDVTAPGRGQGQG